VVGAGTTVACCPPLRQVLRLARPAAREDCMWRAPYQSRMNDSSGTGRRCKNVNRISYPDSRFGLKLDYGGEENLCHQSNE